MRLSQLTSANSTAPVPLSKLLLRSVQDPASIRWVTRNRLNEEIGPSLRKNTIFHPLLNVSYHLSHWHAHLYTVRARHS
jgi:hypothetical protein